MASASNKSNNVRSFFSGDQLQQNDCHDRDKEMVTPKEAMIGAKWTTN